MELRHLKYFVTVAEELHFRRAAERLHISQPPLSLQIRDLERELGAKLFDRSQQRVTLTAAGRVFLKDAQQILGAVKDARTNVRRAVDGEVGELRIGFTQSSEFLRFLPETIHRFGQHYPDVTFGLTQMTSAEQLEAVAARRLDFGISRKPSGRAPTSVALTKLYSDPLVLALHCSDPLASGNTISIRKVRDRPFIASPRESGSGLRNALLEMCRSAGFLPKIVQEAREVASMIGFVAAGVGVSVVPASAQCIRIEGIRLVPLTDKQAQSALYFITNVDDRSKLTGQFRQMLLEATLDLT